MVVDLRTDSADVRSEMQTYEMLVKERSVRPNSKDMTLVRTSVGIDQIHVVFDSDEWIGFPITVTFCNGDTMVTQSMDVRRIAGSDDWSLEGTCVIPHEVIQRTGPIRVTFQGTDSEGRHIITARGAPLYVEEAGDVGEGMPSSAPTQDEWNHAYARAMQAIDAANEAINMLMSMSVATTSSPGVVMPDGTSITVDDDGTISTERYVLPTALVDRLGGVMPDGVTTATDSQGRLRVISDYSLPPATQSELGGVMVDGVTITAEEDGTIHGTAPYVLPTATESTLGGVRVGAGMSIEDGALGVRIFTNGEIDELTPFMDRFAFGDTMEF